MLDDPKHEVFARAIAEGRSKRDAAIAAGYAKKSASTLGARLYRRKAIAARIAELQQMAAKLALEKMQVTRDRVIEEFARLAFLDVRKAFTADGDLKPVTELDEDTARAIAGLEFEEFFEGRGEDRRHVGRIHKLKFVDKKGALDSLGKYLGMFIDRKELRFPKLSEASESQLRAMLSELGDDDPAEAGHPAGARTERTPA